MWAIWLLLSRVASKVRSRLLGWIFNAPGIYIGTGSTVRGVKCISFGRNFYANSRLWLEAVTHYQNQTFEPRIVIGEGVSMSDGVHVSCIQEIVIRSHVLIGSSVYISDHHHGSYKGSLQSSPDEAPTRRQLGGGGPVDIGENVWIGDNVVIVGPITIGEGSVVGANSVVLKSVPRRTMVVGAPAREIKRFSPESGTWKRL